jgi:hypothetical protein
MVIGKNKTELIEKEPLLKWYSELFQRVIAQGHKKILIIGYGFNDDHINTVLEQGVKRYGLQIYIISTKSPADFKRHLIEVSSPSIHDGLRGYCQYTLQELFADQGENVRFKQLEDAILRSP